MPVVNQNIETKHEQYFRVTLLILLFGYPISSFIADLLGVASNVLSILARTLQVCASLGYWWFLVLNKRFKLYNHWLYYFLFFWVIYGIRIVHDTTNYGHLLGLAPNLYYLFGFVLSGLLTLPFFSPAPINEVKLEKGVFIFVTFLSLITCYKYGTSEASFILRVGANTRLNPISTAFPSGLMVVMVFRRLVTGPKRHMGVSLAYLVLTAMGLFNLAVSSTKSVYIFMAILIVSTLYKLVQSNKKGNLVAAVGVLVAIGWVAVYFFGEYFELTFSRFTEVDGSSEERLQYINGAVAQFQSSPIFGSFLEEKTLRYYPHNPVLEAFMALGLLGGVYYTIYFCNYVFKVILTIIYLPIDTMVVLAFSNLTVAMVSGSLTFFPELWYLMAIYTALPPVFQQLIQHKKNLVWLQGGEQRGAA